MKPSCLLISPLSQEPLRVFNVSLIAIFLASFVRDGRTYRELHALSTRSPQLTRHNNLTTFGSALHNEPQHAVACPPDSQPIEKFVAQRLALCDGRETTVLHLGGVQRDGVFGELEALLDQGGELADAAALLAEDFLGVGGADDCERVRALVRWSSFLLNDSGETMGMHRSLGCWFVEIISR